MNLLAIFKRSISGCICCPCQVSHRIVIPVITLVEFQVSKWSSLLNLGLSRFLCKNSFIKRFSTLIAYAISFITIYRFLIVNIFLLEFVNLGLVFLHVWIMIRSFLMIGFLLRPKSILVCVFWLISFLRLQII